MAPLLSLLLSACIICALLRPANNCIVLFHHHAENTTWAGSKAALLSGWGWPRRHQTPRRRSCCTCAPAPRLVGVKRRAGCGPPNSPAPDVPLDGGERRSMYWTCGTVARRRRKHTRVEPPPPAQLCYVQLSRQSGGTARLSAGPPSSVYPHQPRRLLLRAPPRPGLSSARGPPAPRRPPRRRTSGTRGCASPSTRSGTCHGSSGGTAAA